MSLQQQHNHHFMAIIQVNLHLPAPPVKNTSLHTHSHLTALCLGLPGWAGTRKVKPIWILVKQETVSGSGISWAICKSAPDSRQITMPAPHQSVFYRPDALPATQPAASVHWRQNALKAYYMFIVTIWKIKLDKAIVTTCLEWKSQTSSVVMPVSQLCVTCIFMLFSQLSDLIRLTFMYLLCMYVFLFVSVMSFLHCIVRIEINITEPQERTDMAAGRILPQLMQCHLCLFF